MAAYSRTSRNPQIYRQVSGHLVSEKANISISHKAFGESTQRSSLRLLALHNNKKKASQSDLRKHFTRGQPCGEGWSPERPKLGFMKLVLKDPDLREPIGDVPMMLSSSTV